MPSSMCSCLSFCYSVVFSLHPTFHEDHQFLVLFHPIEGLSIYVSYGMLTFQFRDVCFNVFGFCSKDGNSINVVRYSSSDLGSIRTGDKSKAESCQKLIAKLINETEGMLKYIIDLRSKLFDLKNNVKLWRANELQVLDSKISDLKELLKQLHTTQSGIVSNLSLLKRKIDDTSDFTAEEKRKKSVVNKTKSKLLKKKINALL